MVGVGLLARLLVLLVQAIHRLLVHRKVQMAEQEVYLRLIMVGVEVAAHQQLASLVAEVQRVLEATEQHLVLVELLPPMLVAVAAVLLVTQEQIKERVVLVEEVPVGLHLQIMVSMVPLIQAVVEAVLTETPHLQREQEALAALALSSSSTQSHRQRL